MPLELVARLQFSLVTSMGEPHDVLETFGLTAVQPRYTTSV